MYNRIYLTKPFPSGSFIKSSRKHLKQEDKMSTKMQSSLFNMQLFNEAQNCRHCHLPREQEKMWMLTRLGSGSADDSHRRPPQDVFGHGEEVLGLFKHWRRHGAPHHADVHPGIGGRRQAAAVLG